MNGTARQNFSLLEQAITMTLIMENGSNMILYIGMQKAILENSGIQKMVTGPLWILINRLLIVGKV
jgi:hypothetical protein